MFAGKNLIEQLMSIEDPMLKSSEPERCEAALRKVFRDAGRPESDADRFLPVKPAPFLPSGFGACISRNSPNDDSRDKWLLLDFRTPAERFAQATDWDALKGAAA